MATGKSSKSSRTKVSKRPSLKSQGARYSVTNRKGVTSYYKSSKDAAGYKDTATGKGVETTPGKAVSQYDAAGKAITPESLTGTTAYEPPVAPAPSDPGDLVGAGNQGVASMLSGYTVENNQLKAPAGSTEALVADSNARMAELLQTSLGMAPEPVNQQEIYDEVYKDSGLKQAQNEVNDYTASLNSIVAKRDADVLSMEGQGRGVPEAIIGGQQAQINREAAIAALPVQAQLAAAQGNLQFAQQQMTTMFNLRVADAQANYQWKTNIINSVMDFATKSEQNLLNAKIADLQTKSQQEQANLQTARQASLMAIETGQTSLISAFANLDPKSPTFDADYNRLLSQVRKPSGLPGAPEVKTINGVDMQWNASTQKWEQIDTGSGPGNLKPIKDAEITSLSETWTAKNSVISLVDSLQKNIEENGTQVLYGADAGSRSGATTNLLLALKNLEKTGALDKGTIDVLTGTIPQSKFFATESAQIAALQSIKDTVTSKVDEYVGSYRGTSAETDPRTQRIYKSSNTVQWDLFGKDDLAELVQFGLKVPTSSSGGFDPSQYYSF